MKKNKKTKIPEEKLVANKAYFFQRLGAYIIDIFLVSLVATMLTYPFMDSDRTEKLNQQTNEVIEKYEKKKINLETYMNQTLDLSYQIAKNNGLYSLATLTLTILYFIVFQFYYKGQTIGKKLMNIQIVKYDRTSLTINDLVIRSLIINSILLNMLTFAFMIFASKNVYVSGVSFCEFVQYIILLIIFFMVIFRKDSRGLHDIISNTIVVKKDVLKEQECSA